MPAEAYYFIIGAVLVAVVVAILKGSGLSLRKDRDGIGIEVKERSQAPPPSRPRINVAGGAKIEGSTTGDIAGILVRGAGTATAAGPAADIAVLEQGQIKNARVGDIAAVKEDGAPSAADDHQA